MVCDMALLYTGYRKWQGMVLHWASYVARPCFILGILAWLYTGYGMWHGMASHWVWYVAWYGFVLGLVCGMVWFYTGFCNYVAWYGFLLGTVCGMVRFILGIVCGLVWFILAGIACGIGSILQSVVLQSVQYMPLIGDCRACLYTRYRMCHCMVLYWVLYVSLYGFIIWVLYASLYGFMPDTVRDIVSLYTGRVYVTVWFHTGCSLCHCRVLYWVQHVPL